MYSNSPTLRRYINLSAFLGERWCAVRNNTVARKEAEFSVTCKVISQGSAIKKKTQNLTDELENILGFNQTQRSL